MLYRLAPKRPHATIFTPYVFLSVTFQFAAHLAALVFTVEAAKKFAPEVDAAYNAAAAEAAEAAAAAAAAAEGNGTAVVDAVNDTLAEAIGNATTTNATGGAAEGVAEVFVHPLDAPFHPSLVGRCKSELV